MDKSTVKVAKYEVRTDARGKRLRSMEEKRRIVGELLRGEESGASIVRRNLTLALVRETQAVHSNAVL